MRTEPSPEISIVVVVWGEDDNLRDLIPSLRKTLRSIGVESEIIVCVGPDRMGLQTLVDGLGATFVQAPGPGYGETLRAGLERASGRYVITMDGDFSHRPGYVRTMWDNRDAGEVVLASRYARGAYAEMSFVRRTLSWMLNLVYRKGLSLRFHDLSSGFRMFRREVLEDIGPLEARGLDILPETITKAVCQGWTVTEIPFWYKGAKPWNRTRAVRLGLGYLKTLGGLLAQRNSVRAADYDSRAFDSWIPLQRYWQRARFRVIQDFALDADDGSILDIGCGSSRIIQNLSGAVGMDLALRKLRWLRAPGRRLIQASISSLPFRDESFDGVICAEVIEHIPHEDVHLEELVRVIRPGGTLILGTPDYSRRTWRVLEWIYGKVFAGGYVSEHINRYTNESLRRELDELGVDVEDLRYVGASVMIFKARVPLRIPEAAAEEVPLAGSRA